MALATSPTARETPMTVTVAPRSKSGVFRDTAIVYLDGTIDAGTPDRLSRALDNVTGRVAVWLNSRGGNLFAGMQLGRIIRAHRASTYIIDPRTLLPGVCDSACSLAFLGGIYRFADNGARYGVHRASLSVGRATGNLDLGEDLTAAVASYVHEMGVDPRLLDLWQKAGPDEMYVLSRREAEDLGVVNNGRERPEWSITPFAGGARLRGQQVSIDGTGTVSFSCDDQQTILGSDYRAAGKSEGKTAGGWSHWLTIDKYADTPLKALAVTDDHGVVRATFALTPDVVRRARFARRIGLRMKPPGQRSFAIGYSVDIDDRAAPMVRKFLGDCLRARTK